MVNVFGGSGKEEGRDSACTPRWMAELIGPVKLDPATNERSHIQAEFNCILDRGDDGLYREKVKPGKFWCGGRSHYAREGWDVFINCGYNRGEVLRWVNHYGHTRFIFLLKWSPDTEWFANLLPRCTHVWFPLVRVDFEPPPGVEFSSNPLPHALYLREPSEELCKRLRGAGWLLRVDAEFLDWVAKHWQTIKHEHRQSQRRIREAAKGKGRARRRGGGVRKRSAGKHPAERASKAGAGKTEACHHGVLTGDECSSCFYEGHSAVVG